MTDDTDKSGKLAVSDFSFSTIRMQSRKQGINHSGMIRNNVFMSL